MNNNNNRNTSIVVAQPMNTESLALLENGRRQLSYAESHVTTEEVALGQEDRVRPFAGRRTTPEAANADLAFINPALWFRTAEIEVDSVIQISGEFTILRADYNVLTNLQYVRSAAEVMGAVGRNDQMTYIMTGSGGIWNQQAFSSPNMIMGFQVEFGLPVLNAPAFNLQLTTTNFKGFMGQDVNRSFTLRVEPSRNAGGMFQFLFANRTSGTSEGYHYDGEGGMNVAVVQPAVLGNYDATVVDAPRIRVTVPSSLDSLISLNLRPITAASPVLASLRERLGDLTSGG